MILALSEWLRRLGLPLAHGPDGRASPLGEPGLHGVPGARTWDAVAIVAAPRRMTGEVRFVALEDGTLVVDQAPPLGEATPLAESLERTIERPYRAAGVATGDGVWVVGAVRIHVVALAEDVDGDELLLTAGGEGRALTVDGEPSEDDIRSLEDWAGARHASYVVAATRLDDRNWEVELMPL